MRLSAALIVGAIVLSSASFAAQESRQPVRTIGDLAWLAGEWKTAGPLTVEERWTPPAGQAMLAVSRTVKGDRMVAFEFLRIVQRDGGLVYIAQPDGRPPTEFVLTKLARQSATFENPAHDFPKMIEYAVQTDGTLRATVSDGGQRAETFTFSRQR